MKRQEKLKQLGQMKPSDYSSRFIIPVPHKFYENKVSVFDDIEKNGWTIVNKNSNRNLGAFNIKQYIYDNMIPVLNNKNKSSYLEDFKSVLLEKTINKEVEFTSIDNITTKFQLKKIDLWIFEEHIAFFSLNIELDHNQYSLDELSSFNNALRGFKNIELKESDSKIILTQKPIYEGEKEDILNYLFELTEIDKKSFLNICNKNCSDREDELSNIYNTSINAKLLLGVEVETNKYNDGTFIEENDESCINFASSNEMSILQESPYYLASCSPFQTINSYTPSDSYTYKLVNNGGFSVWKYSAGITLHDSCVLMGLKKDGGPVVGNIDGQFYFIYMLNLYINFQIRHIESKIIDRNFESVDINYWYKKLQKLKNQFVTEDIAVKFQENEFHRSITSALKTEEIMNEVSANLVETKEITQSNTGIYMTLVGYIFVSVFQEPLTQIAQDYGLFLIPLVTVSAYIIYKNRIKIRNKFKL